jgi:Uma2 family endonuclease
MSVTFLISEYPPLTVPQAATSSLSAFREWAGDNDLPKNAKLFYYRGEVWVEMGKEQIFSHVAAKTEFTRVLAGLVKIEKLGTYLTDGVLVTNEDAGLSCNPDSVFVSRESFESGKTTLAPGVDGGFVELVGSPDMVLEVVSASSEKKDTETLLEAYFEAGVREYWLADARGEAVDFRIYRRGPRAFVATRKQHDWLKSVVFGRSFRLVRSEDVVGNPEFTVELK